MQLEFLSTRGKNSLPEEESHLVHLVSLDESVGKLLGISSGLGYSVQDRHSGRHASNRFV